MSYFNTYQQSEMNYLSSLKPEERCWCGWYKKGECNTPTPCNPKDTLADRLKVTCNCGSYPNKPGNIINHRSNCKVKHKEIICLPIEQNKSYK